MENGGLILGTAYLIGGSPHLERFVAADNVRNFNQAVGQVYLSLLANTPLQTESDAPVEITFDTFLILSDVTS